MEAFVVLTAVLLLGPLSVLFGADTRPWDDADRRGWWPAAPRR